MLVDELYVLQFRDGFVDKLVAEGKDPTDEEFFRIYTKDVYLVDLELVRTYAFHYPMPEALRIKETYEIPGLVASQELLDSKEFIINMNFGKAAAKKQSCTENVPDVKEQPCTGAIPERKKEQNAPDAPCSEDEIKSFYFPDVTSQVSKELKVMTMQQNLDFIELCVREVPKILRERYGLRF